MSEEFNPIEQRFFEIYGRSRGHWHFLNEERYFEDFDQIEPDIRVVSLRRTDKNWKRLADLECLEEITAISPTPEQQMFLFSLSKLKRLRLGDIRKTSLEGIENLQSLEELALINVSGPQTLGGVARIPKLRSLLIENMRSVSDFSALGLAKNVECLCFGGTWEKNQSVESLAFLREMPNLRHLCFNDVDYGDCFPVFRPLKQCPNLESLYVNSGFLSLEDWAFLRVHYGQMFVRDEPDSYLDGNGVTFKNTQEAEASVGEVLSLQVNVKGFRYFEGKKATALRKLREFEDRFEAAKSDARKL